MFLIAVYEERAELRSLIRRHIGEYAFRENLICRTLWMDRLPGEEKRAEFFPQIQLALISLDMPEPQRVAAELYRANGDCRIVFFSGQDADLRPLLPVRPIGFFRYPETPESPSLDGLIASVVSDICGNAGSFAVENRDGLYILQTESILYFRSELKNVSIRLTDDSSVLMVRKLSEIQSALTEQRLAERFLRVHQSYIVNRSHIRCLDRRNHWLELTGGEQLPVSDSRYEAVRAALAAKNDD